VYLVWTVGDLSEGQAGHEVTQHIMLKISSALAVVLTAGIAQGTIHALQGGFGTNGNAHWHIWRSTAAAHTRTPAQLRQYATQLWQLLTGEHREPTSYSTVPATLVLAVPLAIRRASEQIFLAGGVAPRLGESIARCDQPRLMQNPVLLTQGPPEEEQQASQQEEQQVQQQAEQQEEQQAPQQEEQQQTTAAVPQQQTTTEAPRSPLSETAAATRTDLSPNTFTLLVRAQGTDDERILRVLKNFRPTRGPEVAQPRPEEPQPRNLFGATTVSSSDSASSLSAESQGKRRRVAPCRYYNGRGCDRGSDCRFSHDTTAKAGKDE
jgi:hypothetical protein